MRLELSAVALCALPSVLAVQIPLQLGSSPLLPGESFDRFAASLLQKWGVPGVAVGIIKVDEEGETRVEFRSYGIAGEGRDVDEDTLFGIASNSKAFTAAAVGQLVETGHFNWTDKVTNLLPGFAFSDEETTKRASLLDLLSHQTGLPRHEHSYWPGETLPELMDRLPTLSLSAELRETFHLHYGTAAHLVATWANQSFPSYLASHIFQPLNMTSTTFSPHLDSPGSLARLSSSFNVLENGTAVEIPFGFNYSRDVLEFNAGAGGIHSSARDMLKWVEALIRQRRNSTSHGSQPSKHLQSVLSPATARELTTPRAIAERHPVFPIPSLFPRLYGLAFFIEWVNGYEVILHGGSLPGFGSQVAWSPDAGIGVVALANADGAGNLLTDMLCYRALDELMGKEPVDWQPHYRGVADKQAEKNEEAHRKALKHDKASSPPSLSPSAYLGSYTNPGYPRITVCAPAAAASSSPSPACAALYSRLEDSLFSTTRVPPASPDPVFLLDWPGYFGASHVLLRHWDGDVWKGAFADIYNETERSPGRKIQYEAADSVRVRFVLDEEGKEVQNMELNGVWGAGGEVKRDEERVEVVFERE
ncbi:hypothetical protein JCM10207_004324 [Rhodosporidiobolus poonsookiae]